MNVRFKRALEKVRQSDLLVLLAVLVVLCVVVSFLTPVFASQRNIMNTLRQVSLTAICGFGLTMIILVGEIDLSVGSQQAIAGISSICDPIDSWLNGFNFLDENTSKPNLSDAKGKGE